MFLLEPVDRTAVVLRPRRPFFEWLEQIDRDLGVEPLEPESVIGHPVVYLLPDEVDLEYLSESEGPLMFVQKHATELFESELAQWITDPELWPEDRGWDTFVEWMDVSVSDMVIDSVDAPVLPQSVG